MPEDNLRLLVISKPIGNLISVWAKSRRYPALDVALWRHVSCIFLRCHLKWISGQNDFKLAWFDFPLFQIDYHNHETKKNQIKLVWNYFDLKFMLDYNNFL